MAEMGIETTAPPLPSPAVNLSSAPLSSASLHAEAWRRKPPFEFHKAGELASAKWRAKCQCGRISFIVKRDRPLNVKICHCRNCQILHGSPFQQAAIFNKEDVAFTPGSRNVAFYSTPNNSQDYSLPTKVSCSFCHSPLFDEGRNMILLMPGSIQVEGTWDEQRKQREVFKPTCHIFYEQRVMDIADGAPKWSGMDGSSTLLNDAGQEVQPN